MSVQYRVQVAKGDERVDGPDDADLVVTVPLADATLAPEVAFMTGRLKSSGSTGALFAAFRSGEAADVLRRLAAG